MPQPSRNASHNHLPSLDGLRAISILMVFFAHAAKVLGHDEPITQCWGPLGVSVFFVISGTLITWLLIREKEETGSVSLRNFYIRRALRILPVFWLLVLCVVVLKSMHVISIDNLDILRAFTFTHDYPFRAHEVYAWWLTHTWSLSVEEQFYLVWPGLFTLLARRKSMVLAATVAVSGPLLRVANYYLLPSLRGQEYFMFHTRIDTLMMGCLAAFLLDSPRWRERIGTVPAVPVLLGSSIFLLLFQPYVAVHFTAHTLTRAALSEGLPTLEAFAIAAAILVLVAGKSGDVQTLLNHPAFVHVGQMSYGLYLWQQLLLPPYARSSVLSLLGRIALIYIISLCSFRFVEKPILSMRKKFRRVSEE